MILRGEKKEEYRDIKDHWIKRLTNETPYDFWHNMPTFPDVKQFDKVQFQNGYRKNAPSCEVECGGIEIGMSKPKWCGGIEKKVFVIKLGNILSGKHNLILTNEKTIP